MSEPHTLASFEALPDDDARDAAMARALGWYQTRYAAGDFWERGNAGGSRWAPPRYFSCGDGDPFANWSLLAEVWRLLRKGQPLCVDLSEAPRGDGEESWRMRFANIQWQGTPHRAACLAAVAAGLVPKETDDE